jgi:hypothetical protein
LQLKFEFDKILLPSGKESELMIFHVFVKQRFVEVTQPSTRIHSKLVVRNGIGVMVYSQDPVKDDVDIHRFLVGVRSDVWTFEAETAVALLGQLSALPVFSLGDRPAAWIDKEQGVVCLPECERICKNHEGDYICGEESGDDGNGEFGMCVLAGFDPAEQCPVHPWMDSPDYLLSQGRITKTVVHGIPVWIPVSTACHA